MKSKEFKTSKGEFVIVDGYDVINGGIKLSEITEKQAKEIVDNYRGGHNFLNYTYDGANDHTVATFSAVNSLNSLIKSLGVHLYENPEGVTYSKMSDSGSDYRSFLSWQETESLTFYNPYIFKKI